MSQNIPFEVQTEIIQRIPATKSLIRFRSVSKEWKSLIDSKDFVKAHALQAHNCHHLLIAKQDWSGLEEKYMSVDDDDDTFPHQKVSVLVPDSVDKYSSDYVRILSGSHGLFCFYDERGVDPAVIWNPSIRKSVAIPVPDEQYSTTISFGVCPRNLDPKLVKITYVSDLRKYQVEVFTLSSGGTWRSPLSGNLPHKSIGFGYNSQAVVDGFIYWSAIGSINVDDGFRSYNVIMSFDLTSEEFTKVNLPDCLALKDPEVFLSVSNLKESLAVLEFNMHSPRNMCHVWMMSGHGCTRSFNKLYSIDESIGRKVGFRKNGAPIIEVDEDQEVYYFKNNSVLAIYEPESKNITNIGIDGLSGSFFVHSYTETLLLQSVFPQ